MVMSIDEECAIGASRSLSEFAPLNSVRTYTRLCAAAAYESFICDDPDDADEQEPFNTTERGSTHESGYKDRVQLDREESEERKRRAAEYSVQGEHNEPIDYRTDDSLRMEAAMNTFVKFCDLLVDAPDVPDA